jgi:hypothetical protein
MEQHLGGTFVNCLHSFLNSIKGHLCCWSSGVLRSGRCELRGESNGQKFLSIPEKSNDIFFSALQRPSVGAGVCFLPK